MKWITIVRRWFLSRFLVFLVFCHPSLVQCFWETVLRRIRSEASFLCLFCYYYTFHTLITTFIFCNLPPTDSSRYIMAYQKIKRHNQDLIYLFTYFFSCVMSIGSMLDTLSLIHLGSPSLSTIESEGDDSFIIICPQDIVLVGVDSHSLNTRV